MQITYGTTTSGVGAFYTWQSKTQGRGKLIITKSSSPREIETHITFTEPFQARSTGRWTFAPEGRGTQVSWSMVGQASANPIMRFLNALWIKPELNEQFDYGLRELKRLCR